MSNRILLFSLLSPLIAGCAGPPARPVTTSDDPTNANAVEAPLPPPSTTLNADTSPDTQPTAESTRPMHMQGMEEGMKGMDMKGMDMKAGDHSMPGMKHASTTGRSQ